MAHICTKGIPCSQCEHYRPDPDNNGRMACFVKQDQKPKKAKINRGYWD